MSLNDPNIYCTVQKICMCTILILNLVLCLFVFMECIGISIFFFFPSPFGVEAKAVCCTAFLTVVKDKITDQGVYDFCSKTRLKKYGRDSQNRYLLEEEIKFLA